MLPVAVALPTPAHLKYCSFPFVGLLKRHFRILSFPSGWRNSQTKHQVFGVVDRNVPKSYVYISPACTIAWCPFRWQFRPTHGTWMCGAKIGRIRLLCWPNPYWPLLWIVYNYVLVQNILHRATVVHISKFRVNAFVGIVHMNVSECDILVRAAAN